MSKSPITLKRMRSSFLLLLAALIWGTAFVGQRVASQTVGAFTFVCIRFLISGISLLPVIWIRDRFFYEKAEVTSADGRFSPWPFKAGILCGLFLYLASVCQQIGIKYTSAGKTGFLTALYIVLVPVFGFLFFKKACSLPMILGVILALLGSYFLCVTETFTIAPTDLFVLSCAFFFSWQILTIDRLGSKCDSLKLSCVEFLSCGIFGILPMILVEHPAFSQIIQVRGPILYVALLSGSVAYTLQVIGQKDVHPAVASLIFSLESVISAISGFLILSERLTGREIIGCILMGAAVIMAQLPSKKRKKE